MKGFLFLRSSNNDGKFLGRMQNNNSIFLGLCQPPVYLGDFCSTDLSGMKIGVDWQWMDVSKDSGKGDIDWQWMDSGKGDID